MFLQMIVYKYLQIVQLRLNFIKFCELVKKSKGANFGSFSMYGDEALPELDTDMTPPLTSKTHSLGAQIWKWKFLLKTSIKVDGQEYICENLQNSTSLDILFFSNKFSLENVSLGRWNWGLQSKRILS